MSRWTFRSTPTSYRGRHLYIHIPVCRYRCDYCDFFSRISVAPERQTAVVERTVQQSAAWVGEGGALETIYIGGGTPSALHSAARGRLMAFIGRIVSEYKGASPQEVTIEVNPEDVTGEFLSELKACGVERISLGVQTFHEGARRAIGRHTGTVQTRRGLELVAARWDGRWSADLITGIPGMPMAVLESDITELLDYAPGHVSLYELGIEESTILGLKERRGIIRKPPDETVMAQLERGAEVLESAGLHRYEISSFSRPGEESRHNLAYWRMAPHIGIGPGAVGTVLPEHDGYPLRITNTRSFSAFLSREDFGAETELIYPDVQTKELLMMGLRTNRGADLDTFETLVDGSFTEVCASALRKWDTAIAISGDRRITVAADRWHLLDSILVDLFTDIDVTVNRGKIASVDSSRSK